MGNIGNVSAININGNEMTIKDAAVREIVNEIISAIGANNSNIAERINDLHKRSFDYTIEITSNNESEIINIQDGIYKLLYVTVTGSGDNEVKTLNNSTILIQSGNHQYLYKDGKILGRIKTNNSWGEWQSEETPHKLSSNYETSSETNDELFLESGDTYEEAFGKIEKAILDDELVISNALIDLQSKIKLHELSSNYEMSSNMNDELFLEGGDTYEEAFGKLEKSISDSEFVISNSLNELFTALGNDTNFSTTVNNSITKTREIAKRKLTDYSKEYLAFEAIQNTTFTFTNNALQYSLDNGITWTTLAANTASPTIIAGKTIMWKQTSLTPNSTNGIGTFSATGNYKVYGNIMSLLYGDNFIGQTSLSGKNYAFYKLFFSNTYLIDSSNLILPATTLSTSCYSFMFSGCTNLINAPILPATTLAESCYERMFENCSSLTIAPELPAITLAKKCYYSLFNGCRNLNYIKCLATTISGAVSNFTKNVAASGTFIKNDNMSSWPTNHDNNYDGIPTGWTVYNENEYKEVKKYELATVATSGSYNDLLNKPTPCVSILYSNLVTLRNQSKLISGTYYRITDYVTTTAQVDTQSAGHQFDIIVRADENNKLNENAYAAIHSGDTYFANSKLEAWELKYCLDNDYSRFAWADTTNGKGVIYQMIDEQGNDLPYDFKNIQFRWRAASGNNIKANVFYYTFSIATGANDSNVTDLSLNGKINCTKNKFYPTRENDKIKLPFNVFRNSKSSSYCFNNILGFYCYSNTFGNDCFYNTFGNSCNSNTFGDNCYSNTFGNSCIYNTFGDNCYSNTFGNNCSSNIFGNRCNYITFGDNCYSNTFGNDCNYNTFGDNCIYNSFGNYCTSNSFGNYYTSNTLGDNCYSNTFGNYCYYNTFGNYCNFNSLGDHSAENSFKNGFSRKYINSSSQTLFANDEIYQKKDNLYYPLSHPDLSTQPSILPQRFGNLPIKEVLIANGRENEIPDNAMVIEAWSFNNTQCTPAFVTHTNGVTGIELVDTGSNPISLPQSINNLIVYGARFKTDGTKSPENLKFVVDGIAYGVGVEGTTAICKVDAIIAISMDVSSDLWVITSGSIDPQLASTICTDILYNDVSILNQWQITNSNNVTPDFTLVKYVHPEDGYGYY